MSEPCDKKATEEETCIPEPENQLLLRDELRGIEKWQTPDEIVTLGRPTDESHNCDEMGCSSVGLHVIRRESISGGT